MGFERLVAAVQAAGGGEIERAEDVVADRGVQDGGREDVQDVGGDGEADQPGDRGRHQRDRPVGRRLAGGHVRGAALIGGLVARGELVDGPGASEVAVDDFQRSHESTGGCARAFPVAAGRVGRLANVPRRGDGCAVVSGGFGGASGTCTVSDEEKRVEMNMTEAVARAAAADEARLRRAYAAGVAHGAASTQCTAEEERTHSPLRLLTLATLHLPDLVLYAYLLDVIDEDAEVDRLRDVLIEEMGATAAGALRLAHRALETHARNVGYQTGVWLDRVLDHATASLWRQTDRDAPVLLEHARGAAVALTTATDATADDRMRVPEELAHGLSDLLVVYLIARTLR